MSLEFTYTLSDLGNNLRLLSVPLENSPSVTVAIFAGVGSRYERAELSGISHVIEHMAFKGTTNRPNRKLISNEIAALGGEGNAGTGYEFTYYYVKMPTYQWEKALDIVSDLTLNPIYPEQELEKEKTVIIQEYGMYEDNPHQKLLNDFRDFIWPDHPLGRKISGTPDTISSFSKEQLDQFRTAYYTRNNLLIAISGGFDQNKAEKFAKTYFEQLISGPVPEYEHVSGIRPRGKTLIIPREQESVDLVLGIKGFNRTQESELDILGVMNTILGGNDTSRLFQNIRDEKGLTYYIGSGHTDYLDDGLFYVRAGVSADRIGEALQAIKEELTAMTTAPVTEEELRTAKEFLKGNMLLSLETSDSVLQYYAFQALLEPTIRTPNEVIKIVDAITIDEVQKIAQSLFTPDNMYLGVLGPVDQQSGDELFAHLH